jgi:AcrR family transcriptional regulator
MMKTGRRRLSGPERRDSLLDTAATIILAEGPAEITLEKLAAEAGVSRALVYQHFSNREELLHVLFDREATRLYSKHAAAMESCDNLADRIRAGVSCYFDYIEREGDLTRMVRPILLSRRYARERQARLSTWIAFRAAFLAQEYGVEGAVGETVTRVLHDIEQVYANAWHRGTMDRATAERLCVDLELSTVDFITKWK